LNLKVLGLELTSTILPRRDINFNINININNNYNNTMDSEADWAANALFSPSKARIVQAQARDWGFVDTWLSKRYGGKRLPNFERNEETLEALLTLATLNEGADEQRSIVDRVEQSALSGFEAQRSGISEDVYQAVVRNMDQRGNESLETLAKTAIVLNAPSRTSITDLATSSIDLQNERFDLSQQQARLETQKEALQREANRLKALLREIKDDAFRPAPDLVEQTVEWTRGSKHLRAKVGEYDDRLSALRSTGPPPVTIEQVAQQSEQFQAQRLQLLGLEAELKAYQSLPTNAREAKAILEQSRDELRKLSQRRDRLFEELVPSS
jgi:HAUS augmin-like complex subunit 1